MTLSRRLDSDTIHSWLAVDFDPSLSRTGTTRTLITRIFESYLISSFWLSADNSNVNRKVFAYLSVRIPNDLYEHNVASAHEFGKR